MWFLTWFVVGPLFARGVFWCLFQAGVQNGPYPWTRSRP